ncbi:MAG: preprotein translocase subunit SecA [bacterium JZ-2024 1]
MNLWMSIWKWIDPNEWEIRRLRRRIRKINRLEPSISALSDDALRGKTEEFRERLAKGEKLDTLLPEAFAVVREVAKRKVGMRHFDVQVMGGIVLHEGKIAEMATGEGKTLVATLPLYLNALLGKGAHLVTVNDYLARRDAMWMGPIYLSLGLKVGVLQHDAAYLIEWDPTAMYGTRMVPCSRKDAYLADITYGTNSEFGFDYLRDNMVWSLNDRVQRELYYAIVDEVDSILIDEARTPLIISGMGVEDTKIYEDVAKIVAQLDPEKDVEIKEKEHTVLLLESGMRKVERFFSINNLYSFENADLNQKVQQGLKARFLMRKDRDYVVKDGEIIIVDEFTGRLMFGRRYSDGLHQAIEAKEKVPIRAESKTLATITIQNYFRMYKKLAGMTGTAKTEEQEFIKIYGMPVVVIPTNRPLIRKTIPDVIYKTEKAKFRMVVKDIVERHKKGQPILVGTTSIENSERLSEMLTREGIPHFVLNAKHHEKEAEIVAQAGRFGAVTIATNMAGRGTDILLGGNPAFLAKRILEQKGISPDGNVEEYQKALEEAKKICEEEHKKVVEVGGLHVLGTERHEARRIDNQLRGRAGRQGDPGSSQFFLSLEDSIMRKFGGDLVKKLQDKWNFPEDEPLTGNIVHYTIQMAQKRVEAHNFEIRKNLLHYDDVLNKQRETIYKERNRVLTEPDFHKKVFGFIDSVLEDLMSNYLPRDFPENWRISEFLRDWSMIFPVPLTPGFFEGKTFSQIQEEIREKAYEAYQARINDLGEEIAEQLARFATLRAIDTRWIEHLDQMEHLREGVSLRGYSNVSPLVIYAREGFDLFQAMLANIQKDIIREIFRAKVEVRPATPYDETDKRYSGPEETVEAADALKKVSSRMAKKSVGRNDPCPCGSGKKYKKCCMPKALKK